MNWVLIAVVWLSPAGYQVTGTTHASLVKCEEAAFYAAADTTRCINAAVLTTPE